MQPWKYVQKAVAAIPLAGTRSKGCVAVLTFVILLSSTLATIAFAMYSPPERGLEFEQLRSYSFSGEHVLGIRIHNAGTSPAQNVVLGFSKNAIPAVLEVNSEAVLPFRHSREIGFSEYALGSLAPSQTVVMAVRISTSVSMSTNPRIFYVSSDSGEARKHTDPTLLERYLRPALALSAVSGIVVIVLLLVLVFATSWLAEFNSEPGTTDEGLVEHQRLAGESDPDE